jgi:hypothetical protein
VEVDPDAIYDQLSALTRDSSKDEIVLKENYGREGAEQIEVGGCTAVRIQLTHSA